MLLDLTALAAGGTPAAAPLTALPLSAGPSMVTWLAAGGPGALSTAEAVALVDGVAASGAGLLRLAGAPLADAPLTGAALARADAFELVAQARLHGLPLVVVAAPEQIDAASAARLRAFAAAEVHVAVRARRGAARGPKGAELRAAASACRRCERAGQRAALAVALTPGVARSLDALLDFAERHGVRRVVFTRARGGRPGSPALGLVTARVAVGTLVERARSGAGRLALSLAGDFAAGPLALLLLARHDRDAALPELERRAALAASEVTVDAAGWATLDPADPATALGSVRERPFDALWRAHSAASHAAPHARGEGASRWPTARCPRCQWVDVCGVDGRVAARAAGVPGTPSPAAVSAACYLTDAEAGLAGARVREPALTAIAGRRR